MDRRGVARLDAQDVCVFNILQKLSRFANRRTDDSVTDIIGYALNIAMCGDATDTPGNTDAAPREVADTTPALSDPTSDTTPALCGEWPKWINDDISLSVWSNDKNGLNGADLAKVMEYELKSTR